jgi:hypothetical protein
MYGSCRAGAAGGGDAGAPAAPGAGAPDNAPGRFTKRSDSAIQRSYDAAAGPPSKSDAQQARRSHVALSALSFLPDMLKKTIIGVPDQRVAWLCTTSARSAAGGGSCWSANRRSFLSF